MRIQNINNYMGCMGAKPAKKDEINKQSNKYDVVEIKNKKNDKETLSLNTIKKNIVSKVCEDTSIEKINEIKDSINNKTYSIDVEEIVKRMLK